MDKLVEKTNTEFLDLLASKAPVPGGGGVAAMTGAYGAALAQMVLNLTIGKKKYAEFEAENLEIMSKAAKLQERLVALVDEDAESFEPLSKAYSMPKEDPAYAETMARCTMDALRAPLQMMHCICDTIDLLERILVTGSTLMMSDVGCGALCARSALDSAAMNVYINTKILKDRDKAAEINKEADAMRNEYCIRAEKIAEAVFEKLRVNNQ